MATSTTKFSISSTTNILPMCGGTEPVSARTELGPATTGTGSSVAVVDVDLDGNGTSDELFVVGGGVVARLNGEDWSKTLAPRFDFVSGVIRIADLNGDGGDEVVVADDGPHWSGARVLTFDGCDLVEIVLPDNGLVLFSEAGSNCYPGGCYQWLSCESLDGKMLLRLDEARPATSLDEGSAFIADEVEMSRMTTWFEVVGYQLETIDTQSATSILSELSFDGFAAESNANTTC